MSVPNTPRPTGSRPQGTARPQGNAQPQGSARPQGNAYPQGRRPQAAPVQRFVPQKRPMLPFILICAGALVLGVLLQALLPNGFSLRNGEVAGDGSVATVAEIEASDTVQLNEVMTANGRLFRDASGRTPDWVEVRNASARLWSCKAGRWRAVRGKAHLRLPAAHARPRRMRAGICRLYLRRRRGGLSRPLLPQGGGRHADALQPPDGVAVEAINIPALAQDAVYRRVGRGLGGLHAVHAGHGKHGGELPDDDRGRHALGRGGQRGHVRQHAHAGRRGWAVLRLHRACQPLWHGCGHRRLVPER